MKCVDACFKGYDRVWCGALTAIATRPFTRIDARGVVGVVVCGYGGVWGVPLP